MSIRDTEGLTAGQIKALNLSTCVVCVPSRAGQARGASGGEITEERFYGRGQAGGVERHEEGKQGTVAATRRRKKLKVHCKKKRWDGAD